jgi:transcription elongation factor Elf1
MKRERYFDCPECDYHTENKGILDELEHTAYGDPICPECGAEGSEYDVAK